MRNLKLLLCIGVALVSVQGFAAEQAEVAGLASAVVSADVARTETFAWGTLITYFSDETYGTKDALAAVAIINPGMQIHPPHEHAEEEYLMVLEGNGVWHLQGRDFPAKQGDMLYASPWDVHGIKNSGDTPLKFVVWKWNNKGTDVPEKPDAR